MMRKIFLAFLLLITGTAMILLNGCSHAKEDEKSIIEYLNGMYGEDSYTIQRDPEYRYNYLVNLKQYPGLEFTVTMSRQPFMLPYIWSDFDEVFEGYVIEQFKNAYDLGTDKIEYLDPGFAYTVDLSSLDELKTSYDRLMKFINLASEEFPVLVDTGLLDIRMDIRGLRLKGDIEEETKYFDICEAKDGILNIKPYDELYNGLASQIKTAPDNSDGIVFRADCGRAFSLGSDTFEDCLYKGLELENSNAKGLENIILAPGELSDIYTFTGKDSYANIEIQVKNLTGSECKLYDATIIKAFISNSKEIYIDPVWIELEFDKRREWIDPYEALKISAPENQDELKSGVKYKNIKVLFEKNEYTDDIKRVALTFEE